MGCKSKYIEVAITLPVFNTYTYKTADELKNAACVGKRVLVPFGNRIVTGYIIGQGRDSTRDGIKFILDILDRTPLFPGSMIPFFKWIANYYIYPLGEVIKHALPGGLNLYDSALITITKKGEGCLEKDFITPVENMILAILAKRPHLYKELTKKIDINFSTFLISKMENKGYISREKVIKGGTTGPKSENYIRLTKSLAVIQDKRENKGKKLSSIRKKIIDTLTDKNELPLKELKKIIQFSPSTIKLMERDMQVEVFKKNIYRDPFGEEIEPDTNFKLTDEQEKVISTVLRFKKSYAPFLLAGVTGSGKTEVYARLAADALKNNLSVIILVPEIALISQTSKRFRSRFNNNVAVLHSGLSAGEKYDQWLRIASGRVNLVIGARSAVFAPFDNLGLIIVDEEHDTSFKQNDGLCYNARDLAIVRAKQNDCVVLLGSATPSIQSYYNAAINKYSKVSITKRVEQRSLPEISVIDLRANKNARGVERFITQELYDGMKKTLARKEQVLLFLNQRGFASHPVCAACGESLKCGHCSISLTFHKQTHGYNCHYCGFSRPSNAHCTICGSKNIKLLGLGTEKIESAVNTLFPEAKVERMDHDTTVKKGSILKILKGLKNQTTDVLIGTQMVAKGHDFSNITLVGIICADLSLNFPDFRACERTFQIIAQVAGRAGRGDTLGRVILQTYNPEHFSILAAKNQDYDAFYDQEIEFRKALNYPPFSRIIQLRISGKEQAKTKEHAFSVGNLCNKLKKEASFLKYVEVLGPIESPVYMIAKKYRWQILLKGLSINALQQFMRQLLFKNRSIFYTKNVKVAIDVDPFFMM